MRKYLIQIIALIICICGVATANQQNTYGQNSSSARSGPPYQKYKLGKGGYQENRIPGKGVRYYLIYSGRKEKELDIYVDYWNRRASELCPYGYEIERLRAEVEEGQVKSDSALFLGGILVPITYRATVKNPQVYGEINCKLEQ